MYRSPERSLRRYTLPLAAALGVGAAFVLPPNTRLEKFLNLTFPKPLDSRVLVVAIDDASLRDYGRLDVWPRELYAQAIRTLETAGAKAVGVDVLLSDSSTTDEHLSEVFSSPNLVLATSPGDPHSQVHPSWQAKTGVSALNSVREFQTGYPIRDTSELFPSLAQQLAAFARPDLPLDTVPHLLKYTPPEDLQEATVSFRDVVNGNIRYKDIQGRLVLIGLTANGLSGASLPDIDNRLIPGVYLQARAVSTLLQGPMRHLPLPFIALLGLLAAASAVWLRDLWGFFIALGALALAAVLWQFGISFPGVTVSLAAVLGMALVALERWWNLRTLGTLDRLTGFGNRLAFNRAIQGRWASRAVQPLGILIVDLNGLARINERHGRAAGDELLRELASRLQKLKRRGDTVYRWGADEFAVLLGEDSTKELEMITQHFQKNLNTIPFRGERVSANVGSAVSDADTLTPSELVDTANRHRYRMKYQREAYRVPTGEDTSSS